MLHNKALFLAGVRLGGGRLTGHNWLEATNFPKKKNTPRVRVQMFRSSAPEYDAISPTVLAFWNQGQWMILW